MQAEAPFRTHSAPPAEKGRFNHQQIAWRNHTQMHLGLVAGQQQGMGGPIPGGGQLPSVPGVGGGHVPSVPGGMGLKGPQQPPQQAQGPQQVIPPPSSVLAAHGSTWL